MNRERLSVLQMFLYILKFKVLLLADYEILNLSSQEFVVVSRGLTVDSREIGQAAINNFLLFFKSFTLSFIFKPL